MLASGINLSYSFRPRAVGLCTWLCANYVSEMLLAVRLN